MHYQDLLWSTLETRRAKNPAYSLRAFAKQLDVSPALLSQLIKGRLPLSRKTTDKIARHLDLSDSEKAGLRGHNIEGKAAGSGWRQLKADEFALVADWYHYGILGLAGLAKNKADPAWIAKRLAISRKEAKTAFDRLKKLKLIQVKNGQFTQIGLPLATSTTVVPSAALRKHHRQNLYHAETTLEQVPVNERHFGGSTVALDQSDYVFVTKEMDKFRRRICERLKKSPNKNRVYTLAMQFFPRDIKTEDL